MPNEKLPPHDVDAEEAVIGSLLIDGTSLYKITINLQPVDFYSERNMLVYETCQSLYQRNETINQITVAQELARKGRLETCGGAAYLSHLISICPTSLDIDTYAQIVFRLAAMRRLITAGAQISDIGYQADPDVDGALSKAEDLLFRMHHGQGQDFQPIRSILDKYFEPGTEPTEEEIASGHPHGLMTGFAGLDELLGGLQRSDLIILAARPSMGKTSLALNIARNIAVQQKGTVAMFSLEMACEPLVLRLLSSEAGVDSKRIRLGVHQTEAEEKQIIEATGILSEAPIFIDDSPRQRVVEIRSKARRLHFERGIDLLIIDHLGLVQGDGRWENRVQEISYISRSLKAIARELNVPLIALSQLSRASEWRAVHKPQLSDLRDSGSIEQDADVVAFIYRDEYYFASREEWEREHPDEAYPPPAEIIVAKHRNGPIGEIKVRFRPNLARFENIATEEPITQ
ncbi:MAG: replicative DNA helicase [Dehalococcoidales bacterium]|nr:replicative DNA helicase [Dehalococcoidales bacterium]